MGERARRPALFRSLGVLKIMNVPAVGLSLSAGTASTFMHLFSWERDLKAAGAIAASTFVVGTLWAAILRSPKTISGTSVRRGWAWSVPLAMLNAAGSLCAISVLEGSSESLVQLALIGMTLGAFVWIPALLAVLICFGVPIAWGQSLAARGLAGEEKGERVVGLACVAIALLSMASVEIKDGSAQLIPFTLGAAGGFIGAVATILAFARELRRERFVSRVQSGSVQGYRVDATEKGRVLLRVASQGHGYRVADVEEELAVLDGDEPNERLRRATEVGVKSAPDSFSA